MAFEKIVAVDFDGTLVEHIYPAIGREVPGAFAWLRKFQAADIKLILWTMRSHKELAEAVDFCRDRGVEFWGINENPDQHSWTTSPKQYAQLYIDDAAVGCPLIPAGLRPIVDWRVVGPYVMHRFGFSPTEAGDE